MRKIIPIVILLTFILFPGVSVHSQDKQKTVNTAKTTKVTFIELGSVNCIPCKMMQPIMKSVEERYGDQIKVVFYDVWKAEQKQYAQKYGIRVIPTQMFLDAEGKEFHRHEGFYPEGEIDKILKSKGLKPKDKKG